MQIYLNSLSLWVLDPAPRTHSPGSQHSKCHIILHVCEAQKDSEGMHPGYSGVESHSHKGAPVWCTVHSIYSM